MTTDSATLEVALYNRGEQLRARYTAVVYIYTHVAQPTAHRRCICTGWTILFHASCFKSVREIADLVSPISKDCVRASPISPYDATCDFITPQIKRSSN